MAKAKTDKQESGAITSIAAFEAKYAGRRVDPKEAAKNTGAWTTGSLTVDKLLNGGVAKGRMVEYYGPPGGGKSTLAIKTVGLALKAGVKCAYFDLERGLDLRDDDITEDGFIAEAKLAQADENPEEREKRRDSWLKTNGVDPTNENFAIYDPESGEELFEMLAHIVRASLFGIVVVDSVPAIMARKALEGDVGDATYGARAKLLAEELPRLLRLYSKNPETTIIFINQVRENIGAQVKSQKATGGYALEHYVRVKIKIQRYQRTQQGDDVVAQTRVKVEKNVYGPAREGMIQISAKRGIDTMAELLEYGIDFGYIHKAGNWHYFFDQPISKDEFKAASAKKKLTEVKGYASGLNGEAAALDWMSVNGWHDKLFALAQKCGG